MPRQRKIRRARAYHLRLGEAGENLACGLLRELNIEVLGRNFRRNNNEIDIVGRDAYTLCFIEVKTRRRKSRGRPADAVGTDKRRQIRRIAHRYLRELGRPSVAYRFDIIEVIKPSRFRLEEIRYHPNAFTEHR
mgnify:CR=1 FL=1